MNGSYEERSQVVGEILAGAVAAVKQAEVPANLEEVAFTEALRLMGTAVGDISVPAFTEGNTISFDDQVEIAGRKPASGGGSNRETEILQRVHGGTGVSESDLDRLIYIEEGLPHIAVPGLKLGKNNAERTRAVAAILTVVRTFGLDEDETPLEDIREEVQRLRVYDSANFTAYLKGLSGYVIKGAGVNRRVQAKAAGIEDFSDLITGVLQDL